MPTPNDSVWPGAGIREQQTELFGIFSENIETKYCLRRLSLYLGAQIHSPWIQIISLPQKIHSPPGTRIVSVWPVRLWALSQAGGAGVGSWPGLGVKTLAVRGDLHRAGWEPCLARAGPLNPVSSADSTCSGCQGRKR